MTQQSCSIETSRRWPHRVAVLLVCATFPLIWVGGLVTTYDAGMAVPDWPSTYGYNLFLYPISTWLSGPWDVLIEHGHRLIASGVGLITILFVAVVLRFDSRRWMAAYACLCLTLVVGQGVLGGLRVLLDQNLLARLHGCTGPIFFAATVAAACFTSRWWQRAVSGRLIEPSRLTSRFVRTTWIFVGLVYVQLVLGAHLRHLNPQWPPSTFRVLVFAHLVVAVLLTIHAVHLVFRSRLIISPLVRRLPAILLACVGLQVLLGAGVWRVKYYWPTGLPQPAWLARYTVTAEGMEQTITVTAHVAMGSLILGIAVLLAIRATRLLSSVSAPARFRSSYAPRVEVTV